MLLYSDKTDKPLVRNMIIFCAIVILIFDFAWRHHFFHNLKNPLFTIVDGFLLGGFVFEAIGAYRYADEPNKEWKRLLVVLITVALIAWAGGWAAYVNEQVK